MARRLVFLVLTAIVPLFAFSAFVLVRNAQVEGKAFEQQLQATTRALSSAVDAELEREKAILFAIRESRSLKNGEMAAFYELAKAVIADQPGARIVLYAPSGQMLMTTLVPLGIDLPMTAAPDAIRAVVDTRQPYISDLFKGAISKSFVLSVYVPVLRDGAVVSILALSFPPDRISRILQAQALPPGGRGVIIDRKRTIIARTTKEEEFLGRTAAPVLSDAGAGAQEGAIEYRSLDGVEARGVFTRSQLSGWQIVLGVEMSTLTMPLWHSLFLFGGGGVLLTGLALGLALYYGRHISRPVMTLAEMAAALGRGEQLTPRRLDLKEAQTIADEMASAGEALRRHSAEREDLMASLEQRVKERTRALKTLSRANEAVIRAGSQEALFEEMCRTIVESGNYRMAWIGLAERDAEMTVRVAASAGHVDGYLENLRITWSDTARGQGPTGTAIRTGEVQINKDFESNPKVAVWAPEAIKRGYRASVALPLRENDETIGVLTIYASEPDAFEREETQLLVELANNISFGAMSLKARAAEQLLSRGVESISDGIVIFDADDRLIWHNRRYADLLLGGKTEALGKTFEELVRSDPVGFYVEAEEDKEDFVQRYLKIHRESGRTMVFGTAEGRWIQARNDHMPDGKIVGVRTDVTSLIEAERRFRSLADDLPGIVFRRVVQPNGEIREVYVSAGVRGILGVEPEEFTSGRATLLDFLHPDDREKKLAMIRESVAKMTPLAIRSERFVDRNGAVRWWQISATPRRLPDGSTQYDGIGLDITEQRLIEDQLRKAQKLEALGQLTSGISHDFNNLLSVVIGSLDMALEQAEGAPKLKALLQTASDGAVRGAGLVKRLLAFSRGQILSPEPTDLNQYLPDLRRILAAAIGVEIEIDLKLGENLQLCLVDPSQIDDVVLNLCINARDAMPSGGKLTIETDGAYVGADYASAAHIDPGRYVLLSVTDTGQGMSREVLDRVFEPFFTTKGPKKGTGLGLSQVYGIVKQSKGHITIESEVGRGTTVRIYLPGVQTAPDVVLHRSRGS